MRSAPKNAGPALALPGKEALPPLAIDDDPGNHRDGHDQPEDGDDVLAPVGREQVHVEIAQEALGGKPTCLPLDLSRAGVSVHPPGLLQVVPSNHCLGCKPRPDGSPQPQHLRLWMQRPHIAVDGRPRGRPAPRRDAHVRIEQPIDLVADHRKCPAQANHEQQDREKESTPAVQSERQAAAEPPTTGSRALGCRHTDLERQPGRELRQWRPFRGSRTIPASPAPEAATSQKGLRSTCLESCEARARARG